MPLKSVFIFFLHLALFCYLITCHKVLDYNLSLFYGSQFCYLIKNKIIIGKLSVKKTLLNHYLVFPVNKKLAGKN